MAPQKREVYTSHSKGWADCRDIPVMAWMEKYTVDLFNNPERFNNKSEMAKYHVADWEHVNADGREFNGFENAFAATQEIYAPFAGGFSHQPRFWVVWKNDDGTWEMVGDAILFANLPEGTGGEKTSEDFAGKKWDLGLTSMFHFWYVEDKNGPDGFLMKRSEVFSDSFPAVQEMMKRGMIKP